MDWLKARLQEKSTWVGLMGLLAALGVGVSTELSDAAVNAGVALGSLISAILVAVNTSNK